MDPHDAVPARSSVSSDHIISSGGELVRDGVLTTVVAIVAVLECPV